VAVVILPIPIEAVNELKTKFPLSILILEASDGVSNPVRVALNGGDVSVGGQHNSLLPEFGSAIVKTAPCGILAVVGELIVILVAVLPVIVVPELK
jgi:hypothetical protein